MSFSDLRGTRFATALDRRRPGPDRAIGLTGFAWRLFPVRASETKRQQTGQSCGFWASIRVCATWAGA